MGKESKVSVFVATPNNEIYKVEIDPTLNETDLLAQLVSRKELQLDQDESSYSLRPILKKDGKIMDGAPVVIDVTSRRGLGKVTKLT